MYKTVRSCAKSCSLLTQISSQSIRSGINHTWIQSRSMRKFIRHPAKVLTDDGDDYDTRWRTQRVSDIKEELSRDLLKKFNPSSDRYYDEAVYDDNNELNYSRKKAKKSFKQSNDFDDYSDCEDNNKARAGERPLSQKKQKSDRYNGEAVYDDNNELNYSRKKAKKSFKQSNDFDDYSHCEDNNKARVGEKPLSQKKQKQKQNEFDTPSKPPNINAIPKSEKELKPRIEGIPVYEKLGENNREFFRKLNTVKMRNKREKSNLILLEGNRIINDAIDANIVIENFYFTKEENLVGIKNLSNLVNSGVGLKKVFYKDMKLFSDLITSPGVMAICVKPDNQKITSTHTYTEELKLPLIVVCDNIRDPGNMGTLIRSCAAFGVEKMVLIKGCVDAWEPKVLRSGCGAHFRIPIVNDVEWPHVPDYLLNDNLVDVFLAESNPSERILESSHIRNEFHSYDNQSLSKAEDTKELKKYITQTPLLSLMYNESNFFSKSLNEKTVLVIGGETSGLSVESYKFAQQFNGSRVKIPLSYGVDSLNSTTAATIIIFEMKRQYLKRYNEQSNQNIISVV